MKSRKDETVVTESQVSGCLRPGVERGDHTQRNIGILFGGNEIFYMLIVVVVT